ncbi:hypothetical protein BgiMline_005468, partial [Biomphalaria glabrata]
ADNVGREMKDQGTFYISLSVDQVEFNSCLSVANLITSFCVCFKPLQSYEMAATRV